MDFHSLHSFHGEVKKPLDAHLTPIPIFVLFAYLAYAALPSTVPRYEEPSLEIHTFEHYIG